MSKNDDLVRRPRKDDVMLNVVERVARVICREDYPCWSIVSEIMERPDYTPGYEGDAGNITQAGRYRGYARAALAEAKAAGAARGVTVKPLEWEDQSEENHSSENEARSVAEACHRSMVREKARSLGVLSTPPAPAPCTCHPDDNPPRPCPQKYALSECRAAAPPAVEAQGVERFRFNEGDWNNLNEMVPASDGEWVRYDALASEKARADRAERERDEARRHISNLLARIHRDGGHHEAQVGTAQAVEDADSVVSHLFVAQDKLQAAEAELAKLREGLDRAKQTMRNAFGAIETGQVEDKDVHGMRKRGCAEARAALRPTTSEAKIDE